MELQLAAGRRAQKVDVEDYQEDNSVPERSNPLSFHR